MVTISVTIVGRERALASIQETDLISVSSCQHQRMTVAVASREADQTIKCTELPEHLLNLILPPASQSDSSS
jgi:hypothetical protein